jgi:hypothetical protein
LIMGETAGFPWHGHLARARRMGETPMPRLREASLQFDKPARGLGGGFALRAAL